MESRDTHTQITFYYLDGRSESFNIYSLLEGTATRQGLQLEIRHLLERDWWIVNLPEQTVLINIDNVVKVEMKPPLTELQGEGVFSNAERVTALNRGR